MYTIPKTIIFDFFGVISSEVAPRWFKENFPADEAVILKEQFVYPADTGEISDETLFSNLSKKTGIEPEKIRKAWLSLARIDPEVIFLIESLKPHHKIALATNASAGFIRNVLADNNLEHLFDNIIISSEIGVAKPDPLFFKKMLEILKEKPENMIFIDDNPANIESAKSLGIESILFRSIEDLSFLN